MPVGFLDPIIQIFLVFLIEHDTHTYNVSMILHSFFVGVIFDLGTYIVVVLFLDLMRFFCLY